MAASQTKIKMWTTMSAEMSHIKAMPAIEILLLLEPQQHSKSTQKQKLNYISSIIYGILLSAPSNLDFLHLDSNDCPLVPHFKQGFMTGDYSGRCAGIGERESFPAATQPR